MNVFKYWVKKSVLIEINGKKINKNFFEGSNVSKIEAENNLNNKLNQLIEDFKKSILKKPRERDKIKIAEYQNVNIVEDLILELIENKAYVTRNYYGAEVINVENIMFLDIDFSSSILSYKSPYEKISLLEKIKFALGIDKKRIQEKKDKNNEIKKELEKINLEFNLKKNRANINIFYHLKYILKNYKDLLFIIYKTSAGLRLVEVTKKWDAKDKNTIELMNQFGCDKSYVALCMKQNCFRARITPKPYRLNIEKLNIIYPYEENEKEKINNWLYQYVKLSENKSIINYITNSIDLINVTNNTIEDKNIINNIKDNEIKKIVSFHSNKCNTKRGKLA